MRPYIYSNTGTLIAISMHLLGILARSSANSPGSSPQAKLLFSVGWRLTVVGQQVSLRSFGLFADYGFVSAEIIVWVTTPSRNQDFFSRPIAFFSSISIICRPTVFPRTMVTSDLRLGSGLHAQVFEVSSSLDELICVQERIQANRMTQAHGAQ
ncbi:hypothetical protein C8F04DRAFT_646963 [Mycena alexandri]|uniref:Uncharacterized protein n=1 Tax=Mycena alexandri TaxID=1745969 RepID=A0AAD6SUD2_9AGAR|nr:hypothetical protein C8F04DRAFT_646963 [Mycena alexandri]